MANDYSYQWRVVRGAHHALSSYSGATLTMNGTAQGGAIPTGARTMEIGNLGATTEAVRVAVGETQTAADTNLTIVSNVATTGQYIPAQADNPANAFRTFEIRNGAKFYAVCNTGTGDTQTVEVSFG